MMSARVLLFLERVEPQLDSLHSFDLYSLAQRFLDRARLTLATKQHLTKTYTPPSMPACSPSFSWSFTTYI